MTAARTSVMVLAALALGSCRGRADAPARPVVRFIVGAPGTFSGEFAREYAERLSTFDVKVLRLRGEANALDALLRGDADLTTTIASGPYFLNRAERREGPGTRHFRAIAALQLVPLQVLVSRRAPIRSLADLHGRRVYVGDQSVLEVLLEAGGIHVNVVRLPSADVAEGLASGALDAALTFVYAPYSIGADAVHLGARLVPVSGKTAERLIEQNPFIRLATIPAESYAGQAEDVNTIGIDVLFVTRSDLDEDVVHEISARLFDVLPSLVDKFPELAQMDPYWAAATPIPLHPGAARFFREWELRH